MSTRVDPRTGLEELGYDDCLGLVAASTLGRLAVVIDGQPLVFPVNFTLDGSAVALRTEGGTKLNAARQGAAGSGRVRVRRHRPHLSHWLERDHHRSRRRSAATRRGVSAAVPAARTVVPRTETRVVTDQASHDQRPTNSLAWDESH